MARQMFTGNYGAPLAQVDTRPILAAGQAWGQAFQNLGQTASDVLEKHRQKKETARNAEVLTGIIENNPEFAQSLGIKNPEEQQSLIKDFAKDPARMQMALDAVSHSQQQKMFQQRQREIGMQNLARAEENLAFTLYNTESGTEPDPQALEQVQRLNQELGLDPRVSIFKAQRAARSFEKADVDARLDARAKQVKTEYTEALTDATRFNSALARMKAMTGNNPDVNKQIEITQKQIENLQSMPVTVRLKNGEKVQRDIASVLKGEVKDIDPKSESEALTIWKHYLTGLQEKQRQYYSTIPMKSVRTNKETGETELVEGTMQDFLDFQMQADQRKDDADKKAKAEKKKKSDEAFYKPSQPKEKKPFITFEGKPIPFFTPSDNDVDVGVAP